MIHFQIVYEQFFLQVDLMFSQRTQFHEELHLLSWLRKWCSHLSMKSQELLSSDLKQSSFELAISISHIENVKHYQFKIKLLNWRFGQLLMKEYLLSWIKLKYLRLKEFSCFKHLCQVHSLLRRILKHNRSSLHFQFQDLIIRRETPL